MVALWYIRDSFKNYFLKSITPHDLGSILSTCTSYFYSFMTLDDFRNGLLALHPNYNVKHNYCWKFWIVFSWIKKIHCASPIAAAAKLMCQFYPSKSSGTILSFVNGCFHFFRESSMLLHYLILGRWLVRHVRHTVMTVLYLKNKWSKMSFFPFLSLIRTRKKRH